MLLFCHSATADKFYILIKEGTYAAVVFQVKEKIML